MITSPLTTPACYLDPAGYYYVRRTVHVVQLFYETGVLCVECTQPGFLMRDLQLDGLNHIESGVLGVDSLFANTVTSIEFNSGNALAYCEFDLPPDNYPVKPGCFLIEGGTWAAYHPLESLQVIGVKGHHIYIFTRPQVYKVNCSSAHATFNSLCAFVKKSESFHLTQKPLEDFWSPCVDRLYSGDIIETNSTPDSIGSMEQVFDLRDHGVSAPVVGRIPAPHVGRGDFSMA